MLKILMIGKREGTKGRGSNENIDQTDKII
jgi:hypothetical protein